MCFRKDGGQYRIRTCDLFHVKETRYQLRQLPSNGIILTRLRRKLKRERKKAAPRFELGDKGFADLCLTTWLCRRQEINRKRLVAPLSTE